VEPVHCGMAAQHDELTQDTSHNVIAPGVYTLCSHSNWMSAVLFIAISCHVYSQSWTCRLLSCILKEV